MAEKKVSRKDLLNEPDEFITTTGQIIRFVKEKPNVATGLVVGLLVIVLAVIGVMNYTKYRHARSHELFLDAHRAYDNLLAVPNSTPENWDKVLAEFQNIANNYSSLPAGELAVLYTGHVLFNKQDYKGALEKYTQLQNSTLAKSGGLAPLFLYHTAMTRFALKEYDAALSGFEQLSKDINSPYRREAYASIARIYEGMGKNMEAVQAYKQYLKMFPEAPDAPFTKTRIAELSAKT